MMKINWDRMVPLAKPNTQRGITRSTLVCYTSNDKQSGNPKLHQTRVRICEPDMAALGWVYGDFLNVIIDPEAPLVVVFKSSVGVRVTPLYKSWKPVAGTCGPGVIKQRIDPDKAAILGGGDWIPEIGVKQDTGMRFLCFRHVADDPLTREVVKRG